MRNSFRDTITPMFSNRKLEMRFRKNKEQELQEKSIVLSNSKTQKPEDESQRDSIQVQNTQRDILSHEEVKIEFMDIGKVRHAHECEPDYKSEEKV